MVLGTGHSSSSSPLESTIFNLPLNPVDMDVTKQSDHVSLPSVSHAKTTAPNGIPTPQSDAEENIHATGGGGDEVLLAELSQLVGSLVVYN